MCRKHKQTAKQKDDALQAASRFRPGSLPYHGCAIFSLFERFHLHEQKRIQVDCSSDTFLQAQDNKRHGHFLQKLSSGKPILLSDVQQYKHLSKQDLLQHPDEWKYAPVLVGTNMERLNICRQKASMWARDHKTFVFKWRSSLQKEVNHPDQVTMETTSEQNAFFGSSGFNMLRATFPPMLTALWLL